MLIIGIGKMLMRKDNLAIRCFDFLRHLFLIRVCINANKNRADSGQLSSSRITAVSQTIAATSTSFPKVIYRWTPPKMSLPCSILRGKRFSAIPVLCRANNEVNDSIRHIRKHAAKWQRKHAAELNRPSRISMKYRYRYACQTHTR
jgi:hypothetical protein